VKLTVIVVKVYVVVAELETVFKAMLPTVRVKLPV